MLDVARDLLLEEGAHGATIEAISAVFRAQPRDPRLLVSFRYEDLVRAAPQGPLADELQELNRPVEAAVAGLARALHGRATPAAVGHVLLVVFDLPYGAVRRHLIAG